MKRILHTILLVLGMSMALTSCQKAPFLTFNGQKSLTFKDTGGTETFFFTCNRAWSVSSSENWLKISPSSGDANEEGVRVTVTCEANTTYDPRTATVTVKSEGLSETISVTQETNYGIVVNPTSVSLSKAEQSFEIEVQANIKYSVTSDDDCKWLSQVGGGTKALTLNKYGFKVSANDTYDNRVGKIYVLGENGNLLQTIEVSQSQTDGLIVSKTSYDVGKDGGDIEVKMQTNVKVEATIPDAAKEWLSVKTNSTKAMADESIVFTVTKNETYYGRTAEVVLKGNELQETITVSQAQTDAMFITNEKEYSFTKNGGNAEVKLFFNVDHIVDGASLPSWISYKSDDVDENNKTYTFSISPNAAYYERNASIVFKSKDAVLKDTVRISQEQVDIVYTDKNKMTLSKKGDECSIIVYSNVNYTIDKPDWLKEKSVNIVENKPLETTYTYTVDAVDEGRTGSITYNWKDGNESKTTVVNIEQKNLTISAEIAVAGTLIDYIDEDTNLEDIDEIIISGPINGTDIKLIRKMRNLLILNLKNAHIVSGGESYRYWNSTNFYTEDNVIGDYMFGGCFLKDFDSIILPNDITKIGDYSFYEIKVNSIKIPNSVKELGYGAFGNCTSITNISLNEGIETIYSYAFQNCRISTITLPSTLKYLGTSSFSCSSLKEVHIKGMPSTLTNIESDSFYLAYHATLYVPIGTKEYWIDTDLGRFAEILEE